MGWGDQLGCGPGIVRKSWPGVGWCGWNPVPRRHGGDGSSRGAYMQPRRRDGLGGRGGGSPVQLHSFVKPAEREGHLGEGRQGQGADAPWGLHKLSLRHL